MLNTNLIKCQLSDTSSIHQNYHIMLSIVSHLERVWSHCSCNLVVSDYQFVNHHDCRPKRQLWHVCRWFIISFRDRALIPIIPRLSQCAVTISAKDVRAFFCKERHLNLLIYDIFVHISDDTTLVVQSGREQTKQIYYLVFKKHLKQTRNSVYFIQRTFIFNASYLVSFFSCTVHCLPPSCGGNIK